MTFRPDFKLGDLSISGPRAVTLLGMVEGPKPDQIRFQGLSVEGGVRHPEAFTATTRFSDELRLPAGQLPPTFDGKIMDFVITQADGSELPPQNVSFEVNVLFAADRPEAIGAIILVKGLGDEPITATISNFREGLPLFWVVVMVCGTIVILAGMGIGAGYKVNAKGGVTVMGNEVWVEANLTPGIAPVSSTPH